MPGCGIGAYVVLLLAIATAGAIGMSISYYSLVAGGQALSPQRTSYGGLVDPGVLAPLRESGLITASEVPDAFHAEQADGSEACAIVGDRLVRLSYGEGNQSLKLADIEELTGTATKVVIRGPSFTITCPFGPDEGAESFRAMLERG